MQKYSVNQQLIETLLAWVNSGEIAIPEIQRPFVWNPSKVRDLIDSLYSGYTTGYLISSTSGSLSYMDVKTGGNYLTGGKEWYAAGRRLNTNETGPFSAWVEPWTDGIGTKVTPTTIYLLYYTL